AFGVPQHDLARDTAAAGHLRSGFGGLSTQLGQRRQRSGAGGGRRHRQKLPKQREGGVAPEEASSRDKRSAQADEILQYLPLSLAASTKVKLIEDRAAEAGQAGGTAREVLRRAEPRQRGVELAQRPQRRADLLLGLRQVAEDAESCARPWGARRLGAGHHPARR